jgi:hypothetical protein
MTGFEMATFKAVRFGPITNSMFVICSFHWQVTDVASDPSPLISFSVRHIFCSPNLTHLVSKLLSIVFPE